MPNRSHHPKTTPRPVGAGPQRQAGADTLQPRGNAAAQDELRQATAAQEEAGGQDVYLHVPFRDAPVKVHIPIGSDGTLPLDPQTPLGRGVILTKATLQLDSDGHLQGGSATVALTRDLTLGSKGGMGVTLKGGEGKELTASLKGDAVDRARWTLDAEVRKPGGDKIIDLSMKEVDVRLGGEDPLFSGAFDVKAVQPTELLNGTIQVGAGGGLKGRVEDNEPKEFDAENVSFALALPGLPRFSGGNIGWLSWNRDRGSDPWDWFWFRGAAIPQIDLPGFGFPFGRLVGKLKDLSFWDLSFDGDGDGLKWKWPNLDFDISLTGFDFDGFPIPRFDFDPSGLLPSISFTPSFDLFGRGGDGKPWFLFNKLLSGKFPLPRGLSVPYEVRFAVMGELQVALKKTDVELVAEMEEYAFDPRSPALPDLTLGAEVPETNVVEAHAWGKAVAEATVPGRSKPAWVGLKGTGEGNADLNAATKASAALKLQGTDVSGAASLGVHTGGGVNVGFDLDAHAHAPGIDSGDLDLAHLGDVDFASPFEFDHDWDASFGKVPLSEVGSKPLVEPGSTKEDPGEDLGAAFDAETEVSSDPKREVEPTEGGPFLAQITQVGNLLDLFGDLSAIFTTVEAILTDWGVDAGSPKDMVIDIARKKMGQAETLVEKTTSFYDKVQKAEKNGLFEFLEENFPGGQAIVAILKGYLELVDATYKGISRGAGALGGTDYEAMFKAMDEAFYEGNRVYSAKVREERELIKQGWDWKTANRVIYLEYKAKVRELDSNAEGRIDPQPLLWTLQAEILRTETAPRVAKSEGFRASKIEELTKAGLPRVAAVEIAALWRLDYVNATDDPAFADRAREWEAEARAAMEESTTDEDREAAAAKWAASRRAKRIAVEIGAPKLPLPKSP